MIFSPTSRRSKVVHSEYTLVSVQGGAGRRSQQRGVHI